MAEDVNAYIAGLSEKYPGPNSDHCLVLIEVDDDVLDDIAKLVHNKILYHLFPVGIDALPGSIMCTVTTQAEQQAVGFLPRTLRYHKMH